MDTVNYQRVTVRHGEDYFTVYCTQQSLEHRRDEVILWVDSLARRLRWTRYDTEITEASVEQATQRPYALFEHRFPGSA
jgi:hypothetical protein